MDIETVHHDYNEVDWDLPVHDGGDDHIEPPHPGYGPGRRPRRRRYPVEKTSHTLTLVICLMTALMSGLFLLTMAISKSGGGIGAAYALSLAIAVVFMGTFYVGGLWLGAQRGVLARSLSRAARPGAPGARASTGPRR